jgi:hypothetical protein
MQWWLQAAARGLESLRMWFSEKPRTECSCLIGVDCLHPLWEMSYRHTPQVNQCCPRKRATEGTGPGTVGDLAMPGEGAVLKV